MGRRGQGKGGGGRGRVRVRVMGQGGGVEGLDRLEKEDDWTRECQGGHPITVTEMIVLKAKICLHSTNICENSKKLQEGVSMEEV